MHISLCSHSLPTLISGLITYHMVTLIQVQKVPSYSSFGTWQLLSINLVIGFPGYLKLWQALAPGPWEKVSTGVY